MRPDAKRRPLGTGAAPHDISLAPTVPAIPDAAPVLTLIPGRGTRRRPLLARASLFEPSGNRTWYWLTYRCVTCGRYQLGRARTRAEAGGRRRAPCGHVVWVKVMRTYGANDGR